MTTPSILTSYTDRLSYVPGASVTLFASSPTDGVAGVQLVRLDAALDSPGQEGRTTPVPWDGPESVSVGSQRGSHGSFMIADVVGPGATSNDLTLGAFIRLSAPAPETRQSIVCIGEEGDSLVLGLQDGRVVLRRSARDDVLEFELDARLHPHTWYFMAASVSHASGVTLHALSVDGSVAHVSDHYDADVVGPSPGRVVVAGEFPAAAVARGGTRHGNAASPFTGKVGWPFLARGVVEGAMLSEMSTSTRPLELLPAQTLIGGWSLAYRPGAALNECAPVGDVTAGLLVNLPTRGVTGHLPDADAQFFWDAPETYEAIHFHDTDVVDAGWDPTFVATLPVDLPSGVYGLRLEVNNQTDTVPFCVSPNRADVTNRVLVVLPTFTYLAYANETLFEGLDGEITGGATVTPSAADLAHVGNRTFGLSQYDRHSDGSGVAFSSAARPIVNMRHDYQMWLSESGRGFSAEMYLIEWLRSLDIAFDVVTDLEVHSWGAEFLSLYRVVLSGAHPEYTSGAMLDAFTRYRDCGGALMYLGGNGYYWVTGVVSEEPLVIEIRRDYGAVNAWTSEPGESGLVSSCEKGGLWRHRGRAPQKLVGLGMAAQGWGGSEPYHRTEASRAPEHEWIFDGVDEEPLGAYGRVMGGAAGDELDRVDASLGTPPGAVVLASSRDHSNYYQRAREEVAFIFDGQHGGQVDSEVHSDIIYFMTPSGGQVFAAGSIAFSGSLLENGGRNGIAKMTENVLRRFADL